VSPEPASKVIATVTQNFSIPAAIVSGSNPSVFNVTFDFSSQPVVLTGPVVYGISFDGTTAGAPSLNVALSNAATQLTVGTDVNPGYVFADNALTGDAGACATGTSGSFQLVHVWCGDTPLTNYGAYGDSTGADIPAVEINVVGGGTPPLYPGDTQTIGFAINNPNPGNVYVNTVTIGVATDVNGDIETVAGDSGSGVVGCDASWFIVSPLTVSLTRNVATGITEFAGVASITLHETNTDQSVCEGKNVVLNFSSN
jgi:hypothetical protein